MHIDRLTMLREILEDVAARERPFDMAAWISRGMEPCGTTACALGYAALDQRFQSLGLLLTAAARLDRVYHSIADYNTAMESNPVGWCAAAPVFGEAEGFAAGAACFDISRRAAMYLFDPDEYGDTERDIIGVVRPEHVIERINAVIAYKGEPPPDFISPELDLDYAEEEA